MPISSQDKIERFEYPQGTPLPAVASATAWAEASQSPSTRADTESVKAAIEASLNDTWEKKLVAERQIAFEKGREQGLSEGRCMEQEAGAALLAESQQDSRKQAAEWTAAFITEKQRYMQSVEEEVVKLALAIASRILYRESQVDPLLLTGAVRTALGQLSDNAEVRLHVPASDYELWRETISMLPHSIQKPIVESSDNLQTGDCRMTTQIGTVNLGIRAQLSEIEHDLVHHSASAAHFIHSSVSAISSFAIPEEPVLG